MKELAGLKTVSVAWKELEAQVIDRVRTGIDRGGFTRDDIAGVSDHFGDERTWILCRDWPKIKQRLETLGWCIKGEPQEGPFSVILSFPPGVDNV